MNARVYRHQPVTGGPMQFIIEEDSSEDALRTLLIAMRRGQLKGVAFLGAKVQGMVHGREGKMTVACNDGTELVVSPVALGDGDDAHRCILKDTAYMLEEMNLGDHHYFVERLLRHDSDGTFKQGMN